MINQTIIKSKIHILAALIVCASLFSSCFKKVDVAQIAPVAGLLKVAPLTGVKNTIINISGNSFPDKAGIQVTVNGKAATIISSTSNSIQAQVAPATGSGPIKVTYGGATYDGGTFTYIYTYTVTSYTNGQSGYLDGPVATAQFEDIEGIAIDKNDNLYNAQYGAPRVRKINTNTGVVSTLTSGPVGDNEFISTDAAGNVYVADETGRAINKIDPAGNVKVLFKTPFAPHGVKVGKSGTVYVSGLGSGNIAAYNADGTLKWRLRTHGAGNVDGDTSVVKFATIGGIEVDDSETKIYVQNYKGGAATQIKLLDLTAKTLTTIAGTPAAGYADGAALSAQFAFIYATRLDSKGGLYIVDLSNNRIRYLINGQVTTVIGSSAGDQDGIGTSAKLSGPQELVIDSKGNLWISDYNNLKIKKVVID